MREGCAYCGGIVCVRTFTVWQPGYSTYDPRKWLKVVTPDIHCRQPRCRALHAYWAGSPRPQRRREWWGPARHLYELATFLHRMADPQTWRDLEFSKRFAHSHKGAYQ